MTAKKSNKSRSTGRVHREFDKREFDKREFSVHIKNRSAYVFSCVLSCVLRVTENILFSHVGCSGRIFKFLLFFLFLLLFLGF